MSSKRDTDEFKTEAVWQVTDWGYPVKQVADRLRITTHSLYAWLKHKFNATPPLVPASVGQSNPCT